VIETPLVVDIVRRLLEKGEVVRCRLQSPVALHEGHITDIVGTTLNNVDTGGAYCFTVDNFASRDSVSFTKDEIENLSHLKQIDVGWHLTIHYRKKPS
jgi:hypothetical protein